MNQDIIIRFSYFCCGKPTAYLYQLEDKPLQILASNIEF